MKGHRHRPLSVHLQKSAFWFTSDSEVELTIETTYVYVIFGVGAVMINIFMHFFYSRELPLEARCVDFSFILNSWCSSGDCT